MQEAVYRAAQVAGLCLLMASAAQAAGTAAGSTINNVAQARFVDGSGQTRQTQSNIASLRVDEVVEASLVADAAAGLSVESPAQNRVQGFSLSNPGNGPERYRLYAQAAVSGDDFDALNPRIYLDDGDQVFDAARDILYVPGLNEPSLAADGRLKIFLLADIPAGQPNAAQALIRLDAEALTVSTTPGQDAPGTVFAGQGEGGSDALAGLSGGAASASPRFLVQRVATRFDKSFTVLDRYGGSQPTQGAIITYTLALELSGSGTLPNVALDDPIPAGTSYRPGSLTLDGATLSDTQDADLGHFSGQAVHLQLGALSAPRQVLATFQVSID